MNHKWDKYLTEKICGMNYFEFVLKQFLSVLLVEAVIMIPIMIMMDAVGKVELCIFVVLLVACWMFWLMNKQKNYQVMSMIVVSAINCIIGPLMLKMGGGLYNVAPMCFAISVILIYSIFEGSKFFLFFAVCILEYSFLYREMLYKPVELFPEGDAIVQFWTFTVYFMALAGFIVLAIYLQEKFYKCQKQKILSSSDRINNSGSAKSQFLTNMSHEIRTPMNSIIGLSEILLKEELDDEARTEVNTIRTASYDLLSIIDDVLTYAKIDAGDMHLIEEDYCFEDLFKGIISAVSPELQRKKLHMDIKINHNIPKVLLGDSIKIRQIFLYLLFISIDSTTNGRVLIDIDCENDYENNICMLKCKVADTGKGLSEIDVDSLFGTYDTYDSRQSSNLKGIGLKFAICKEMLAMMQGDIKVESITDVGLCSTFTFCNMIFDKAPMIELETEEKPSVLIYTSDDVIQQKWQGIMEGFRVRPHYIRNYHSFDRVLQEKKYDFVFIPSDMYEKLSGIISLYNYDDNTYVVGDYNNVYGDFGKCRLIRKPFSCIVVSEVLNNKWNKEDFKKDKNQETFTAKKAKVLVVDDNVVNLKVAAGIFKKYGIDIAVALSGEDGIRKIENEKYDLVLMDMVMPDMTGDEVLRVLRAKEDKYFKEIPIVALTAQNGSNVREEIMEFGFQDYLAKPIKTRYLEKCLLEFLPEELIVKIKAEGKSEAIKAQQSVERPPSGLNTEKGLLNIGFNKDAYAAILNTYYTEGVKYLDTLPLLLEVNDIRLFTTNVHGIKSSSASIGAMEVSALFKELEFAGKAERMDEIHEKFPEYMKKFKEILEIVKQYLIDNGKLEEANSHDNLEEKEVEELTLEALQTLKNEMDRMNLKVCDERIPEMAGKNFGPDYNAKIKELKNAYDMFDFHQAKIVLNELIDSFAE